MGSTGTEDEEPTVASLWEAQRWGCGGLLHLVQALAAAEPVAAKLYVVTRGAQAAAEAQAGVALAQAPVWGLARTIALEHPELGAVRIDVDPRSPAGEVEQLAAELLGDGIEDQVALRDGRRRVARLARLAPTDPGRRPDIRGDASYLITGGLGGLGLVVARWLLDSGAGNVVLSGRSELSPAKRERLAELQGLGGQVCYARGDIAERDDAARLLRDIRASGAPLAGIVHAAGVLDDGVLTGQSWERFVSVMEAKVAGAWNLHELTWQQPLDFFLLFSAGAALLGSPGQGNYAAANAFLDALAQRRRSDGLAALSVNWGPWEGVGMAAALQRQHRERHAGMGIEAITPEEGIAALDRLLARTVPQVAVLRVHDWDAMAALAPSPPPLLAELSRRADPRARRSRTSELEVRRRLQSAAPAERREVATAYVREQVCKVMGIDPLAPPDLDRPLGELGLDSLMATQLKNQLDRLGAAVPLAWLLEGPSTGHLVDAILSLRSDEVADTIPIASAVAGGAANEAEDLLSRLPELSEQQVDSLLDDLLADGNAADE
jgi:NAD(P)-dependent dehydrogenase (short-subunit alcohol dehydrogenase family)